MQERKTNHTLLYLAYEQMVIKVRQLQRNNWVRQPKREWCTRARQPMKEFCKGVREHLIEDLCVGVRYLQLGVRQLPLGARIVKYATSLPCIGLSESVSKLYINFEFCEGKNHKHMKNIDLQSQEFYVDYLFLQENSTYFRRQCK